jgi:hypothetical protein
MNDTNAQTAPAAKAKAEGETVKMLDGREILFAGKKKMLKDTLVPGVDGYSGPVGVRLDFRNGGTIVFHVPEALSNQFAAHGASQKLGDEGAGEDDVDDMQLAIEELAGRLTKGEWSAKREGSGMGGVSILVKALAKLYPDKTLDYLKEKVKGYKPAERTALELSPKVKPIIEALRAEKLAKAAQVDTDTLLADLA